MSFAYAIVIALIAIIMTFGMTAFHRARDRRRAHLNSTGRRQRLLGWWRR
ncbi:hypothetical protein [Sphingomonas sp.]